MFNEFDFKLTLFTVTNWGPYWTGLQSAASHGHEIASHTVTHASLNSISDSLQTIELKNSQQTIDAFITGQKCVTIAYPNCNVGNTSIVKQYYLAARGCSGAIESKTPGNFMNISSIVCGSQGSVKTGADFKSRANTAASSGGWCVYLLHGINNDGGYSPLPSDTLRRSLEYLKANPEKFWLTSFGNAAKYIRERNAATVSEILVTEGSITVNVSDTLNNMYYDCPITVRRPLPQDWSSAYVVQNGDTVASQIVEVGSVEYLVFDVVPDYGNITLIKNHTTSVELQNTLTVPSSVGLHQNYPNPFNPTTTISYYIPQSQNVEIKLFDILGNEVATLVSDQESAGLHVLKFSRGNLSSGVYFYRLRSENIIQTRKLVLLR
jgi:oligosaccharide reducing-end xylanase